MHGRFPSSQEIEIQNRHFLLDCGEGTQMQLMRFHLSVQKIDHIFISHLHGDHFLGLMGLIFTFHLQHRAKDLHIYGHMGLDEILTTQLRYSRSAPCFKIRFHALREHAAEVVYEDEALVVESIPLAHRIPCAGFIFREKIKPRRINKATLPPDLLPQQLAGLKAGKDVFDQNGKLLYRNKDLTNEPRRSRSYAYCSDTAFDFRVVEAVRGVDVLYHEATFTKEEYERARDTGHSTAYDAAVTAKQAGVGRLLLGHFSARYKDLNPLLDEAREVFSSVGLADEGQVFTIDE